MKYGAFAVIASGLFAFHCAAAPVIPFMGLEKLVQRSNPILIAKCIEAAKHRTHGLGEAEVEIIRTIKGERKPGKEHIATACTLTPGRTYLLFFQEGASYNDGWMVVQADLAATEIPRSIDVSRLATRTLEEEIRAIWRARRDELEAEKKELDRALSSP